MWWAWVRVPSDRAHDDRRVGHERVRTLVPHCRAVAREPANVVNLSVWAAAGPGRPPQLEVLSAREPARALECTAAAPGAPGGGSGDI